MSEKIVTALPAATVQEVLDQATCLHNQAEVEAALDKMAAQMNSQLADKNPVFLCVVIGAIIPLGHLLLRLNFPLEVDYIHVTRYYGTTKGRELKWKAEPSYDLKDRVVVIVDDILDSGITMNEIVKHCQQKQAKEVLTAVLVDKEEARQSGGLDAADFTGLVIENRYVFGYGLDYKEYLRNAPGIYAVKEEHEDR